MSSMTAGETSLAGFNGAGGKFRLSLAIGNRKSKRDVLVNGQRKQLGGSFKVKFG